MIFRYSGLDTATKCLQKYKHLYVDGIKPDEPESSDAAFGTALHTALQASLEGDDGEAVFRLHWDNRRAADLAYKGRHTWDTLSNMGDVFISRFNRLHKKHYEPIELERVIKGRIGAYDIQGTVDYIGKYRDKLVILDFKTANYAYLPERIHSNLQMPIYRELVRQDMGLEAEQLVYQVFVKNPMAPSIQTMVKDVDAEFMASRLSAVEGLCKELEGRTEWPRNPSSCMMGKDYRCPFFESCWGKI